MKPLTSIWMNGKQVPWHDAQIHVLSHVVHYGSSFFEGIRSYKTAKGKAVLALDAHMRRLIDSARIYRTEIPYNVEQLNRAAIETILANGLEACYIRPVVYRGFGELGVNPLQSPVDVAIAIWEWGAYLGQDSLTNGVDVMVSSWNRISGNTLPGIAKAGGGYMNAQLAKIDAVRLGYADAIMLDVHGMVSEASGANLFVVKDGVIYTPPVGSSILIGITRNLIIRLARDKGLTVIETEVPRGMLYTADELFFTGTAAEVCPIRSVDKVNVGTGTFPVTRSLQDAFFGIVKDGNDPYNMLTFF
ncbi:MAG: branched-chain amino acid transaminase [Bacteroidetes bacterium]|nr:branched-chain amino acid transaminase [Bacteroidota bacterium]